MKKKIIGFLVCMLLIVTALSATGITNFQTKQFVKENKDLEYNLVTLADSPGIITIKIVAKIKDVHDPHTLLGGTIQIDDTITGKYIYDSGTPDSDLDPNFGLFEHTSSTFGIELKAGGFVFKTNQSNVDFQFIIGNNVNFYYYNQDIYIMASYNNLPLSNGIEVETIGWRLDDTTATALSSDDLPTTAPVLSNWTQNLGLIIWGRDPSDPYKTYELLADVTKATKGRTSDVFFTSQPILTWLLEHFSNLFSITQLLLI
jgi:hypothetical protein